MSIKKIIEYIQKQISEGDDLQARRDTTDAPPEQPKEPATTANQFTPEGKPTDEKPETPGESEEAPREPEEEPSAEKEYLGSKGQEEYFYLVRKMSDAGELEDLQVVDAEDELIMSAKEHQMDINDARAFILFAIKESGMTLVSYEAVMKYIFVEEKDKEIEQEDAKSKPEPTKETPKELEKQGMNRQKSQVAPQRASISTSVPTATDSPAGEKVESVTHIKVKVINEILQGVSSYIYVTGKGAGSWAKKNAEAYGFDYEDPMEYSVTLFAVDETELQTLLDALEEDGFISHATDESDIDHFDLPHTIAREARVKGNIYLTVEMEGPDEEEQFDELKKKLLDLGIDDGEQYYIGNGPEMVFMDHNAYKRAKSLLNQYGVHESKVNEYIKEIGNKWRVMSHSGRNMGTYDTKEEAEKRLGQVEMFKHMKEAQLGESHVDLYKSDDGNIEMVVFNRGGVPGYGTIGIKDPETGEIQRIKFEDAHDANYKYYFQKVKKVSKNESIREDRDLLSSIKTILAELFVDKEINVEKTLAGWEITVKGVPADLEGWKDAKEKLDPYIERSSNKILVGGKDGDLFITVEESIIDESIAKKLLEAQPSVSNMAGGASGETCICKTCGHTFKVGMNGYQCPLCLQPVKEAKIDEDVTKLSIDPKYLFSIAHKEARVKCIWWYNVTTGEIKTSTDPKHLHSHEIFKDIAYKPGWIRGRVFEFENKVFLIIYDDRVDPNQLVDIIDKLNLKTKLNIDHVIDIDGKDMSALLESLSKEVKDRFNIKMVVFEQEMREAKPAGAGEKLLSGSNSCEDFEWEDLTSELTNLMKSRNPSGLWKAAVSGFGWRGQSGQKTFDADNGEKLLQEILPKTECNFDIYALGKDGLAINNFHHDSPMGAEWYEIEPRGEDEVEEAIDPDMPHISDTCVVCGKDAVYTTGPDMDFCSKECEIAFKNRPSEPPRKLTVTKEAYDVMKGQAGDRVIISWKYKDSSMIGVSHFASVEEFLKQYKNADAYRRPLEWYRVGEGEKVMTTDESKVFKQDERVEIKPGRYPIAVELSNESKWVQNGFCEWSTVNKGYIFDAKWNVARFGLDGYVFVSEKDLVESKVNEDKAELQVPKSKPQKIFKKLIDQEIENIKKDLESEDTLGMDQYAFHDDKTVAVDAVLYDVMLGQAEYGFGKKFKENLDAQLKTEGYYLEAEGGGIWMFVKESRIKEDKGYEYELINAKERSEFLGSWIDVYLTSKSSEQLNSMLKMNSVDLHGAIGLPKKAESLLPQEVKEIQKAIHYELAYRDKKESKYGIGGLKLRESHLSTIISRVKSKVDAYDGDAKKAAREDFIFRQAVRNLSEYDFGDESKEEREEADRLYMKYAHLVKESKSNSFCVRYITKSGLQGETYVDAKDPKDAENEARKEHKDIDRIVSVVKESKVSEDAKSEIDYSQLFYDKEIKVSHPELANGRDVELSVEIRDFDGKPDAKIGHFGHNFWFRTAKGLREEEYATRKDLESDIERLLKKKGFTIKGWVSKSSEALKPTSKLVRVDGLGYQKTDQPADIGAGLKVEKQSQTHHEKQEDLGVRRQIGVYKETAEMTPDRRFPEYEAMVKEDFASNWKVGDYIDKLGEIIEITPKAVRFKKEDGKTTMLARAVVPPSVARMFGDPIQSKGKLHKVDLEKMFKTGDVGEAINIDDEPVEDKEKGVWTVSYLDDDKKRVTRVFKDHDEAYDFLSALKVGRVREVKLDPDTQEVADFSKKHKFGSVDWQNAMIARIRRKLKAGEKLSGIDTSFIQTQRMHNTSLEIEELEKLWKMSESKVNEITSEWKCQECGHHFNKNVPKSGEMKCPKCGSFDIDMNDDIGEALSVGDRVKFTLKGKSEQLGEILDIKHSKEEPLQVYTIKSDDGAMHDLRIYNSKPENFDVMVKEAKESTGDPRNILTNMLMQAGVMPNTAMNFALDVGMGIIPDEEGYSIGLPHDQVKKMIDKAFGPDYMGESKVKIREDAPDIEEVQIGLDNAGKYEYVDAERMLADGDTAYRVMYPAAEGDVPYYFSTLEAAQAYIREQWGMEEARERTPFNAGYDNEPRTDIDVEKLAEEYWDRVFEALAEAGKKYGQKEDSDFSLVNSVSKEESDKIDRDLFKEFCAEKKFTDEQCKYLAGWLDSWYNVHSLELPEYMK